MFEDLIKEMEKLASQKTINIPIDTDDKGYIDKQCPNEECEFLFKVNQTDWGEIVKDEAVWCPLCRHEAPAEHWYTHEQVKHAREEGGKVLRARVRNSLKNAESSINRKQNNKAFISVSMKVEGGRLSAYAVPARAAEEMQLEIQCEKCDSRFAVIGSAYFCPACGYNSVERTFKDSLRKIAAKVDNLQIIRQALTAATDLDAAELACRSLLETSVSDGVVAFQRFCECKYQKYAEPPFNAFQRLKQGSGLWTEVVDKGYDSWVSENELMILNVLFQKRHLLAHREGIVDSKYIEKSGDTTYAVGQRIVILEKDVRDLVSIIEKLAVGINDAIENA